MRNVLFLLPYLIVQTGYCVVTNQVNFGGGVDYSNICTEIQDNRACDTRNMIGDIFGSAGQRKGSERYIAQAISTEPVNSTYFATFISTGATYKALIITTGDKIYYSSHPVNPQWILLKEKLKTRNQHFSFVRVDDKVAMTGDALTDPIYKFNVATSSFSELMEANAGTESIKLRAKYLIAPQRQLVLGNCLDVTEDALKGSTTLYADRIYYSLKNIISSFTYSRFISIRTGDGEPITGLSEKFNNIQAYKPSSINDINYSGFLELTHLGGDIVVETVVADFGLIAPRTLVNIGAYDLFLTKDARIVRWDGGRKSRINLAEELAPLSSRIRTVLQRVINSNLQNNAHAFYYPKKQWYILAVEDPLFFPKGRPNICYVLDLNTEEWWVFDGWLPASFTSLAGSDFDGSLLYGDANDGYVHYADINNLLNDSRKEIAIDTFDSTATWTGTAVLSTNTVVEGSGSVKMELATSVFSSTITKMVLINFGEWHDRSQVLRNKDKFSFKLFISSIQNLSTLKMDLQYGSTSYTEFNSQFTGITVSSNIVSASSGAWAEVTVNISSFLLPTSWNDVNTQEVPFSRTLTVYGIRFNAVGVASTTLYFDDLRVVGDKEAPINSFYLSKQINMGTLHEKDLRQLILTRKKGNNSSFFIDILKDFGKFSHTESFLADIDNSIFVLGYKGNVGIAKLDSRDFSVINSTFFKDVQDKDFQSAVASKDSLFAFDSAGNTLFKIRISSYGVYLSSTGSLGSGTTNFNTASQIALEGDENVLVSDSFNNKIKKFRQKDLKYVNSFGELGTGTTNLSMPTGITADANNIWVGDDGNFRIVKLNLSTYGFVSEKRLDTNTIATISLQNDDDGFLYAAYNKVTDKPFFQDVILEKRRKSDSMELVLQKTIRPTLENVGISTYSLSGDIALLGDFIYVPFTPNIQNEGNYYVQKLYKEDFSLVNEYKSDDIQYGVVGDGRPDKASLVNSGVNLKTEPAVFVQFRYFSDNSFRLHNYSFATEQLPHRE